MPFTKINTSEELANLKLGNANCVIRLNPHNTRGKVAPSDSMCEVKVIEYDKAEIGDYWVSTQDFNEFVIQKGNQYFAEEKHFNTSINSSTTTTEKLPSRQKRSHKFISVEEASGTSLVKNNKRRKSSVSPLNTIIDFMPRVIQYLSIQALIFLSITRKENLTFLMNAPNPIHLDSYQKLSSDGFSRKWPNRITLKEFNTLVLPRMSKPYQYYLKAYEGASFRPEDKSLTVHDCPNLDLNILSSILHSKNISSVDITFENILWPDQKEKKPTKTDDTNKIVFLTPYIPTKLEQEDIKKAHFLAHKKSIQEKKLDISNWVTNRYITHLRLQVKYISDAQLAELLKKLPNLTHLTLAHCDALTSNSISTITNQCKGLESLSIYSSINYITLNINESSLRDLVSKLSKLKTLDIGGIPVNGSFLAFIAQHAPQLEVFKLSNCEISSDSIREALSNELTKQKNTLVSSNVQSLHFSLMTLDTDIISFLPQLFPNLHSISFCHTTRFKDAQDVPDTVWDKLSRFSGLKNCRIASDLPYPSKLIRAFSNLETLGLVNAYFSKDKIHSMLIEAGKQCKQLRHLTIGGWEVTGSTVSVIQQSLGDRLESLKFEGGRGVGGNVPFLPIDGFKSLTELQFMRSDITEDDLLYVAAATPNLRILSIKVDDFSLARKLGIAEAQCKDLEFDIFEELGSIRTQKSIELLMRAFYYAGLSTEELLQIGSVIKEITTKALQNSQNLDSTILKHIKLEKGFYLIEQLAKEKKFNSFVIYDESDLSSSTPKKMLSSEEIFQKQKWLQTQSTLLTSYTKLMLFLLCPSLKREEITGINKVDNSLVDYLISQLKPKQLQKLKKEFRTTLKERKNSTSALNNSSSSFFNHSSKKSPKTNLSELTSNVGLHL